MIPRTAGKAVFRTAAGRAVSISAAGKAAFRTVAEMAITGVNGAKAAAGISAAIRIAMVSGLTDVKVFLGVNPVYTVRTVATGKSAVRIVRVKRSAARTVVTMRNVARTVVAERGVGRVSGGNVAVFQTAPLTARVRNTLKIPPSLMRL